MVCSTGDSWAWVNKRRELSKETASLESLRQRAARGGADGVVQGACAFRASDNLWLPIGQVSLLCRAFVLPTAQSEVLPTVSMKLCLTSFQHCTRQPVSFAFQHAGGVEEAELTSRVSVQSKVTLKDLEWAGKGHAPKRPSRAAPKKAAPTKSRFAPKAPLPTNSMQRWFAALAAKTKPLKSSAASAAGRSSKLPGPASTSGIALVGAAKNASHTLSVECCRLQRLAGLKHPP